MARGPAAGTIALDAHPSAEARRRDVKLWGAVAENLRADLMPPAGKPRPSAAERARLIDWIRADVQRVDCRAPDPGRVTLRRLNSSEYTFTIRDLFAVDVDPSEFLPPDDSGYGFDNIGDVLSVSPLLMEKYFDAAERVVRAVVAERPTVPELRRGRHDFKVVEEPGPGRFASEARFELPRSGRYQLRLKIGVGSPAPFAGKVAVQVFLDGRRLLRRSYAGRRPPPSLPVPAPPRRGASRSGASRWTRRAPSSRRAAPSTSTSTTSSSAVRRGRGSIPSRTGACSSGGRRRKIRRERLAYARELLRGVADRAYRRPVEESTARPPGRDCPQRRPGPTPVTSSGASARR